MTEPHRQLTRQLGVGGATLLGLGSILGTGVFVSLGIAAGIAGPAVLIAIVLAGFVALCNALSSAQLAAAYPVAGGTYEYGYKYLRPMAGFTAGWMFLVAKSTSAATAALSLGHYLVLFIKSDSANVGYASQRGVIALIAVAIVVLIVSAGIRRTAWVNASIVMVTLGALAYFCLAGAFRIRPQELDPTNWVWRDGVIRPIAHAVALVFVAYTGYGRLATLGEEVHHPQRTIPIAILVTLLVSILLYLAVAAVAVGSVGAIWFAAATEGGAPLEVIARGDWRLEPVAVAISIGAVAAMGGVLLNLILGLSRVLLAMGRRGDMPGATAYVNKAGTTPTVAVIVVGVVIAGLVMIGDVKATWSLAAFTVLIYYGITNAAALRMPPELRRYPRFVSWIGLASCMLLAFSVDARTIAIGGSILAVGWLWYGVARLIRPRATTNSD